LTKDDKRSIEVDEESDGHVELIGANMLMRGDVSSKEFNLLKRKNEFVGTSDNLIVTSDMAFTNELNKKDMIVDKEESTCLKRSAVVE
jgi:hypothetical protein